ncbi:hypothetical protein F5Y18DRAFT_246631 [Xylariaceae sp. FL1019]|nr:hypothetical protein F5Y18DRAFT_246631 [Xylariaceae sp. FL1019]
MSNPEKRKASSIRSTNSTRSSTIIAAPPRAQFIRSAASSPPSASPESLAEPSTTTTTTKDHTPTSREKTLQEKIASLQRELATTTTEFTHALDALSHSESSTATFWQSKHATLHQQFTRADTELRLLRTEVDVREAEKLELREEWEVLRQSLSQKDDEIQALRSQIQGLKQWVSTSTKKSDQVSDEEFGESFAKLRNGLQNWAVSHFRKTSFNIEGASQDVIDDLAQLVPMYEELAVSETKAAFLQSIVSSVLVDMIFQAYFVGLPNQQATQLSEIERYLAQLSSAEAVNEWRAMTLSMLRKESAARLQSETDALVARVVDRVNTIMDSITSVQKTDVRDQGLYVLVHNAISLARLLVAQKAVFKVTMPKIQPYQRVMFEAETMDHIGEEEEDSLIERQICCVTFPGILKTGDENGRQMQFRNVIAKAKVLCSPE